MLTHTVSTLCAWFENNKHSWIGKFLHELSHDIMEMVNTLGLVSWRYFNIYPRRPRAIGHASRPALLCNLFFSSFTLLCMQHFVLYVLSGENCEICSIRGPFTRPALIPWDKCVAHTACCGQMERKITIFTYVFNYHFFGLFQAHLRLQHLCD